MNVLFFNSIGAEVWGGGEKWMLTAGRGLRRRGHAVSMAGRGGSVFLERCQRERFPVLPLTVRGDFDPWVAHQLGRLIRRAEIDVGIANFNKDVRLAALARGCRRRMRLVARNGLPIVPNNWRHRLTYRLMVDGLVTNTEAIRRRYLSYGWMERGFIRVIPNGIDPVPSPVGDTQETRRRYGIAPGEKVVGFFGRLVKQKQPGKFLEAARLILNACPTTRLLVVGDGPEREELQRGAERLGLAPRLCMAGFQKNVFPFYQICDVVLLTSQDEGLPNVVMEAMLTARPVVAFDVGGTAELIGSADCGILVPPDDTRSLAEHSVALLSDPEGAAQMGRRAGQRIREQFTVDVMVDRLESYLCELTGLPENSPSS